MKRILLFVFVLLLTLTVAGALAQSQECSVYGEHRWYVFDQLTPTCTQSGWITQKCDCGRQNTRVLSVAAHQWRSTGKVEATCMAEGLEFFECTQCLGNKTTVTPKGDHQYRVWEVVWEASCSEKGIKERECILCSYLDRAYMDKLPHTYGPWIITRAATDRDQGARYHICDLCNYKENQSYYPAGTLWADATDSVAVMALQTYLIENGYLSSVVDGNYGKKTQQAVTDYQKKMGFEPTGVAYPQTLQALFCLSVDGEGQPMSTGDAHVYGDWQTLTAATDHTMGVREHSCLLCGYGTSVTYYPEGTITPEMEAYDAVCEMQRALIDQGYLVSRVDGDFGKKTQEAVRKFQRAMGFEETGIAYPQTLNALLGK